MKSYFIVYRITLGINVSKNCALAYTSRRLGIPLSFFLATKYNSWYPSCLSVSAKIQPHLCVIRVFLKAPVCWIRFDLWKTDGHLMTAFVSKHEPSGNASRNLTLHGTSLYIESGCIGSSKWGNLWGIRSVNGSWDDSLWLASSKWQQSTPKQAYSVSVVYKDMKYKIASWNKQGEIP